MRLTRGSRNGASQVGPENRRSDGRLRGDGLAFRIGVCPNREREPHAQPACGMAASNRAHGHPRLTVQYWRRWFFFLPGYLGMRSSLWLLLGWFSPRGFVYLGFPILMFVMFAMSIRLRESPKLRAFDRATLLVTAACLLAAMLEFLSKGPNQMALLFAAIGDVALLTSWIYSTRNSRQRAAHDAAPVTLNR
jgi:hypothetical protein